MQARNIPISNRISARAALAVAAACGGQPAYAQTDCLTGFNCGRVAWVEYVDSGSRGYRFWTSNLDGSRRRMLLEFGPSSNNFPFGEVFSRDFRKLYFTASAVSTFDSNIFSINVDGTGLTNLTNSNCSNSAPHGHALSLSPDGSMIVFVRNCGPVSGNAKIWIMNVDGSGQRLLTTSPLVNSDPTNDLHRAPQFSPDGSKIMFTSTTQTSGSEQIYLSSIDGITVVALTNREEFSWQNTKPRFMPDGRIVFASRRDRDELSFFDDLYRIDADGSNVVRLTHAPGRKYVKAVSPDNTRLLFHSDLTPELSDGLYLHLVRTNGADLITLSDPALYWGNARFSPDGTRIGFSIRPSDGPTTTRVVNLDGSDPVDYADPVEDIRFDTFGRPDVDGDGIIDGADSCPEVPNGYRIALSSSRTGNYEIWTTDFNGAAPQRLTVNSAIDTAPRFDATGTRIVFHSNRFNSRNEIFSMNADGSGLLRLTNVAGNNITPAFNHDGSKITFIASRDGAQRNVWIMDADGANQIKLTTNQGFSNTANNPVFNHDGTRIAFDSDRGQIGNANHDIYSISSTGTDELRLTTATGRDTHPAYSPDGSRIVFISFRDGETFSGEIYTMNADGSDQRRVTTGIFRESEPAFTADGAQIVFRADDHGESEVFVTNRDGSGRRRITDSTGFNTNPTAAPQPDRDGDGIGDPCDDSFDVATAAGTDVMVNAPEAEVTFSAVTGAGSTSFVEIDPSQGEMPPGYALCETCPAYDITTTAVYTPPVTVCLGVPDSVSAGDFLAMRLLHGEAGSYVDRTAFRVDEAGSPRLVCGIVQSLSPFALATFKRATSSTLSVSPRPSRRGEPATFTVLVDGIDAPPVGGGIVVTTDTSETCSSETPVSSVGAVLSFACEITFASHGPRVAQAQFIESSTHGDSESAPIEHAVMRVVDVSVAATTMLGGGNPGDPMRYGIELRNLGPDAAPAVNLSANSMPPLVGQVWTCTAHGGAVCAAAAGSGDIDIVHGLPVASGLEFVITGSLPQSLPPQVRLATEAAVDGQAPHFVFDTDPANNSAIAVPDGDALFASGFESK